MIHPSIIYQYCAIILTFPAFSSIAMKRKSIPQSHKKQKTLLRRGRFHFPVLLTSRCSKHFPSNTDWEWKRSRPRWWECAVNCYTVTISCYTYLITSCCWIWCGTSETFIQRFSIIACNVVFWMLLLQVHIRRGPLTKDIFKEWVVFC